MSVSRSARRPTAVPHARTHPLVSMQPQLFPWCSHRSSSFVAGLAIIRKYSWTAADALPYRSAIAARRMWASAASLPRLPRRTARRHAACVREETWKTRPFVLTHRQEYAGAASQDVRKPRLMHDAQHTLSCGSFPDYPALDRPFSTPKPESPLEECDNDLPWRTPSLTCRNNPCRRPSSPPSPSATPLLLRLETPRRAGYT